MAHTFQPGIFLQKSHNPILKSLLLLKEICVLALVWIQCTFTTVAGRPT